MRTLLVVSVMNETEGRTLVADANQTKSLDR